MECLFCTSKKKNAFQIFGDKGKELDAAEIINKHFWFKLDPDKVPAKAACSLCWKKVQSFHSFYCEVEECYQNYNNKDPIEDDSLQIAPTESNVKIKTEIGDRFQVEFIKTEVLDIKSEYQSDIDDDTACLEVDGIEVSNVDTPLLPDYEEAKFEIDDEAMTEMKPYERTIENNKKSHLLAKFFKMECDQCDVQFTEWNKMKVHFKEKHNMKGYVSCKMCKRKVKERTIAMDHIQFHENPDSYKCNICDKRFHCRAVLAIHTRHHYPDAAKVYQCHHCSKRFMTKHLISTHILSMHTIKSFPCTYCNKRYGTHHRMNQHIKTMHEKDSEPICEICARSFATVSSLQQHRQRMHSENKPMIQCPDCGKCLKQFYLTQHSEVCSERKNKGTFVCEVCSKVSPTKFALRLHTKYVHESKVYSCAYCERMLKSALALREHQASHTGIPLYTCPVCQKGFNCKSNKYVHIKKSHEAEWQAAQSTKQK